MKKQLIGIAANEIQDSGTTLHHMPIAYTPLGYVKAVQKAGGLALMLPISEPEAAKEYISQIDKLVLAGGQNVSTKFYGQHLATEMDHSYLARDEFELALIDEALKQEKPIFAVCRGMQLINVALGGDLLQKIESDHIMHMQTPVPKEIPTHAIETKEASTLRLIYGQKTQVNSFHYQALNKVAAPFETTAWSPDGIIEGIEAKKHRILGVQWHPDFAYEVLAQEMQTFDYVVNQL